MGVNEAGDAGNFVIIFKIHDWRKRCGGAGGGGGGGDGLYGDEGNGRA